MIVHIKKVPTMCSQNTYAKNINWLSKVIDFCDHGSMSGEEEGVATEEDPTQLWSVLLAGPDHVPF